MIYRKRRGSGDGNKPDVAFSTVLFGKKQKNLDSCLVPNLLYMVLSPTTIHPPKKQWKEMTEGNRTQKMAIALETRVSSVIRETVSLHFSIAVPLSPV